MAMSAAPSSDFSKNTTALFARVSRNSARVILPINNSALNSGTPAAAFYCVHSISGVAGTDFLDLALRLDPTVRFYGIQAPPKQMQLATFGDGIDSIADHYAEALVKFQPTGPLVVGGYCAGAVIALAIVRNLIARGRQVGPLVVINGAPENTDTATLRSWNPRYWAGLARNLPGWSAHADLMRNLSLRSLLSSLSKNAAALGKGVVGMERSQKLGGGFAMDGLMDLTIFPPDQQKFINRLVNAMFAYVPEVYSGDVLIYEAKVTPLLYLPQIGQRWRRVAPNSRVVEVLGTHLGMMHEPYVDEMAKDLRTRIIEFFAAKTP